MAGIVRAATAVERFSLLIVIRSTVVDWTTGYFRMY